MTCGRPQVNGTVRVRIMACYVDVGLEDLLLLTEPFDESEPEIKSADTPETGGYRITWAVPRKKKSLSDSDEDQRIFG